MPQIITKLSKQISDSIERINCSLSREGIAGKISDFTEMCGSAVSDCVSRMGLEGKFDAAVIGYTGPATGCFGLSSDSRTVTFFLDNIEDSRQINYSLVHSMAHAQDVFKNNFDYHKFALVSKTDIKLIFFIWDIFVDGRLSRESYFSYFQSRGLYYDYKMKFRDYSARIPDECDDIFESAWNKTAYGVPDIVDIFEKLK